MNLHQATASQSANKIANLGQTMFGGCFVTRFRFFKRQKHKYNHGDCLSEWCALLDCMTRETETTVGQEPCEFHVFCYQLENPSRSSLRKANPVAGTPQNAATTANLSEQGVFYPFFTVERQDQAIFAATYERSDHFVGQSFLKQLSRQRQVSSATNLQKDRKMAPKQWLPRRTVFSSILVVS